jgi:hypothetical protein
MPPATRLRFWSINPCGKWQIMTVPFQRFKRKTAPFAATNCQWFVMMIANAMIMAAPTMAIGVAIEVPMIGNMRPARPAGKAGQAAPYSN